MSVAQLPKPRILKLALLFPGLDGHDPAQLVLDLWPPLPPLPDPKREAVCRLFLIALEVLGGHRPPAQLRPLVTRRVFEDFLLRHGRPQRSYRLRRVRFSQPGPRVLEANGLASTGPRWRAIAARLDRAGEKWVATALDLV